MKNSRVLFATTILFSAAFLFPERAGAAVLESSSEEPLSVKSASSGEQRIAASYKRRNHRFSDFAQEYTEFKNRLDKNYGLDYSVDVTYMPQWGAPSGKHNANQTIIAPSITWTTFDNEYGTGTLNVSYTYIRYGNSNASVLGNKIGVATGINDYTTPSNQFNELYYTYQLGGGWDWLTLALGQFPVSNFDGGPYNSNQQVNFINEALSQNGSSTYATSGVGTYVQVAPNSDWTFVLGAQDASNIDGISVRVNDLGDKHYTTFGSISYTPTVKGLGQGQYSVLVYNQPWVEAQQQTTNGWSLNLSQNLGEKWAVFARVNGVSGNVATINQSWVLGAVYNDPLERNPLDQIGLAFAYNKIDESAVGETLYNSAEKVVEAYWAWGLSKWMTVTPDIQLLFDPALNSKSDTATVFSLRTTIFF